MGNFFFSSFLKYLSCNSSEFDNKTFNRVGEGFFAVVILQFFIYSTAALLEEGKCLSSHRVTQGGCDQPDDEPDLDSFSDVAITQDFPQWFS